MNITEITRSEPMLSTVNRGLMVAWINADLMTRAACDVRKSVVLYDADRMFIGAFGSGLTFDQIAERVPNFADVLENIGAHYYSHGIA